MSTRPYRAVAVLVLAGMAAVAACSVNLMLQEPLTGLLLWTGAVALAAALPGVARPWLAFFSPLLAAAGLYLVWRIVLPLPEPPPELSTSTTAVGGTVAVEGTRGLGAQLSFYAQQLRLGLAAYKEDVYPLTVSGAPQLRLLVITTWFALVWAGLWVGVGLRRPLWGAAALSGILAVCVTMQAEKRGVWLVLGFVVLLALLLAATRYAAGLPRSARVRPGAVLGVVGRAGVLGAVGGALALGALLVFPGIARPGVPAFVAWDPLRQAQGPQIVFNWRQNYPQLLDPAFNFPIMKVTSPVPAYWRANTLELFTGDSWISSGRFLIPLGDRASRRFVTAQEEEPPGVEAVQTFEITGLNTTYLFAGGYPHELELYYPVQVYQSESMALRTDKNLGPRFTYRVKVTVPSLSPQDLVGLGRDYPPEIVDTYLQLPIPSAEEVRRVGGATPQWVAQVRDARPWVAEFQDIYALNEKIVGDAEDPYEIVLRVERYVRSAYSYSLDPPTSSYRSPYAAFLLDMGKGYCQHFAGAAALLLRLNGVPARVAVGFVTGQEAGPQTYQVTTNNAHSWTEAYFPGFGWVPFEPTPGRFQGVPGPSAYSSGFSDPFADAAAPVEESTGGEGGGRGGAGQLPEEAGFDVGTGGGSSRPVPGGVWFLLALLCVLVGWPIIRVLILEVPSRLGPPERRLRALGRRLVQDLQAWGLEPPASLTFDELAGLVGTRVGVDITEAVGRLQAVLYGGATAGEKDVEVWRGALRRVRRRLRYARGPLKTVLALYGLGRAGRLWTSGRRRSSLTTGPASGKIRTVPGALP